MPGFQALVAIFHGRIGYGAGLALSVSVSKLPVDHREPAIDPDDPAIDPDDPAIDPDNPVIDPDDPVIDPDEPAIDPEYAQRRAATKIPLQNLRTTRDAVTQPISLGTVGQELRAPTDDLVPGQRIGQYELIRLIGIGGMGAVYLARDLRLGRLVAIKLLAESQPEVNERFSTEALAIARCTHDNIVAIYDVGEHEGRPYMVLEYVEGTPLNQWLEARMSVRPPGFEGATHAPIPASVAVALMMPVVRALIYAHAAGIVHRDLKPSNIVVTHAGSIKVLDFGIASLREDAGGASNLLHSSLQTKPGAILGTLPYMSPEQLDGHVVDQRADLWAIGIMLYEMVIGEHPTMPPGRTALHGALIDAADLDVPVPSARKRMPELGALGDTIDRCLVKNKEHRIASAEMLLAELEAFANHHERRVLVEDDNPFVGLSVFDEADSERFFGRSQDVTSIAFKLRERPLVAVTGVAGIGKSSLIRAGLVPGLKRSATGWDAFITRPGPHPLAALYDVRQQVLRSMDGEKTAGTLARENPASTLQHQPGKFGAELRSWAKQRDRRVLLVIDQFEDLYSPDIEPNQVSSFINCLDSVADDPSSPLRVIIVVRLEFLGQVAGHRDFMNIVNQGLHIVSPLTQVGLRAALTRPIAALDHRYEDTEMLDEMIDIATHDPTALPLVQFAASRLWAQRDRQRRLLTRASYVSMGGVKRALGHYADAVMAGLNGAQKIHARDIFEHLITPFGTAIALPWTLLCGHAQPDGQRTQVLQTLIDAQLVTCDQRAIEDRMVELTHAALISGWPTLASWLNERREDATLATRVRIAAMQWEYSGHDPRLLWQGQDARDAVMWRARQPEPLGSRERAYLDAVSAAEHGPNRRWRRQRWISAAMIAALAAASVLLALAVLGYRTASQDASRATVRAHALQQELAQVRQEQRAVRESARICAQTLDRERVEHLARPAPAPVTTGPVTPAPVTPVTTPAGSLPRATNPDQRPQRKRKQRKRTQQRDTRAAGSDGQSQRGR